MMKKKYLLKIKNKLLLQENKEKLNFLWKNTENQ